MIRYRAFRLLLAVPLIVIALWAAAAAVGSLWPVNGDWRPADAGVRIYVIDNGIHTGIVVPAAGWDDIVRPGDFRDPRYAGHGWRSFGWGDRAFYIETPTWRDVRVGTVLRAALGSERTVMHVDALAEPRTGPDVRSIVLRPDEFARLSAFIRASFAQGGAIPGYGPDDVFYPARGRYSAIRTCNAWTGEALRYAGVRIGAWTPTSGGVMRWLPR
ncbi:TIGR02117 family protein [Sphingomonas floccifaciens]|uniref:TIGR02117 family protein n=1 Tax=Sphingomonas floccifaciens TaxID=1844115 RepID=A0ABW4NBA0_9SPHN